MGCFGILLRPISRNSLTADRIRLCLHLSYKKTPQLAWGFKANMLAFVHGRMSLCSSGKKTWNKCLQVCALFSEMVFILQDIAFCVRPRFRLSFISSWRGPGLWWYDTVTAHTQLTGVFRLDIGNAKVSLCFSRCEAVGVSNRSLHADSEIGSGLQKCFEGTWPAKSGIITYKQDGYQKPQDAFFHITLSESTCRLYLGGMPLLWFSFFPQSRELSNRNLLHISYIH